MAIFLNLRYKSFQKYFVYFYIDLSVLNYLSKCMGTSLEKVEILDWKNRSLFYFAITQLLGSKDIGQLDIKFETLSQQDVLDFLYCFFSFLQEFTFDLNCQDE